ncbi:hypothetical protein X975_24231, partial [Stegodyphus mimosarum]
VLLFLRIHILFCNQIQNLGFKVHMIQWRTMCVHNLVALDAES